MTNLGSFYWSSRYRGNATPENIVFNANLQEFAQKVEFIVGLQTGGKLSAEESYVQIEILWEQLRESKQHLGIDKKAG
ncbi:conserved hypothetical protein [Planktothrix sp. PCC 11201]|uniref:DUF7219 family protein n=1 Tax=Planktothrix sp. PCC 11201 TaxID=1729650 RepID=UPI0009192882|nr:hypothetical protein [Planktothrix sp. PCC 11201]SKB11814.1 conserved hypothetical protein [Planktothrix sp. PCC 11201]